MENKKNDEMEKCEAESRRKFLKQAGKLAVYTPPAMVVMMKPSYATFRKSGGASGGYDGPRLNAEQRQKIQSFWQRLMNWLAGLKSD